jgi:hypothetical protein
MAEQGKPPKETRTQKELALYRGILEQPDKFETGFGWTTVAGILFCGLIMLPGSIYLGLMSGSNLNAAASWVTVILFNEIARRSLRTLTKQNLVILLHAAHVVMAANVLWPGGPIAQLVFRGYLVSSEAMRDANMQDFFPSWWVPAADSEAITTRNLLHPDWYAPIALLAFVIFIGFIKRYTLGYFFFRITSDIENLPYPMASVSAQGAMAMAEADEHAKDAEDPGKAFFDREQRSKGRKKSERWRLFSLGAVMGIGFGTLQVGIPAITGVLLDKPIFLIPQPFIDTTNLTEAFLPATPTGIALDLGFLLIGMVLPFWAIMGTFFAVAMMTILNPILFNMGVLTQWRYGMDTVNTKFTNEMDFWLSFSIGAALGLLTVSVIQSIRDIRKKIKALKEAQAELDADKRENIFAPPVKGRGDYPLWVALIIYIAGSVATIGMTMFLLSDSQFIDRSTLMTLLAFLVGFSFIYSPLISYLNARLLGIAGQRIHIPYVKETAFILSGARGIEIWMAPIPIENFGYQAQAFRQTELTGTRFWSLVKTDLVAVPMLFILSFAFWWFIWQGSEIPSAAFPYAQKIWGLQSKRMALQWSATHVVTQEAEIDFWQTEFGRAIHPRVIGMGAGTMVTTFTVLSIAGLPVMFCYGMVRGFGLFPQMLLTEVVGALIGRFYLRKKFGAQRFLRIMPTLLAGYFTGVGLIGMATIAINLIQKAISAAPF